MAYDLNVVRAAYIAMNKRGASQRVQLALFATGLVESGMRTGPAVRNKDHDSAGFLQQRPSKGWGTLAQVEDPTYAANKFLDQAIPLDKTAGAFRTPGWIAAEVQKPAKQYRGRYDLRVPEAASLILFSAGNQWVDDPGGTFAEVPGVIGDTLGAPLDAVQGLVEPIAQVSDAVTATRAWFANRKNITRVAFVATGAGIMLIAARGLVGESIGKVAAPIVSAVLPTGKIATVAKGALS